MTKLILGVRIFAAQREAIITERQQKREIAKEAWMLNHQKGKQQQNAGSSSKSKAASGDANRAAEDDISARLYKL